ncbi:hypothetical protein V2O64_08860 [Verrucomicrobiaceae bacterium 227]
MEEEFFFGQSFDEVHRWLANCGVEADLNPSSIDVHDIARGRGVDVNSPEILALLVFRGDLIEELGVVLFFNHKEQLNCYRRSFSGEDSITLKSLIELYDGGFQNRQK